MSTVVLDIGADTGALVLYTPADLDEQEIEISRGGEPRTHSQVHKRYIAATCVFAAVYPGLVAGEYVIWRDAGTAATTATITGGTVTTCHWPEPLPAKDRDGANAGGQAGHSGHQRIAMAPTRS